MAYFSFIPNVYVGEGVKDNEPFKYRLAKNISRRIKVREDLEKYTTYFETYSISDGETPAVIAEAVLGRKLETTGTEVLKAIHPHPTMSEAVMEAVAAAYDEVIHL